MVIKRAERQAREEADKKSGDGGGASGGGYGKVGYGKGGDGKGSAHDGGGRRSKHAGRMSSRRVKYRRNELQQMQQQEVHTGCCWAGAEVHGVFVAHVLDCECVMCSVRHVAHRWGGLA